MVSARTLPVVTWADPARIVYGTALSAAQLNATADVAGTFVYDPAAGAVLTPGEVQTLSVTFTPYDLLMYGPATKTVLIDVQKAVAPVAWAVPAAVPPGTVLGAAQLNATSTLPGTFVYTPATGTVVNATVQLFVVFTPDDTANYSNGGADVQLTVTGTGERAAVHADGDTGGRRDDPGRGDQLRRGRHGMLGDDARADDARAGGDAQRGVHVWRVDGPLHRCVAFAVARPEGHAHLWRDVHGRGARVEAASACHEPARSCTNLRESALDFALSATENPAPAIPSSAPAPSTHCRQPPRPRPCRAHVHAWRLLMICSSRPAVATRRPMPAVWATTILALLLVGALPGIAGAQSGIITTVAGTGVNSSDGDGGPATAAGLASPYGIAVDSAGNVFIADGTAYKVRRVDAATGIITTVAGTGGYGSTGDGGPATAAELNLPAGVAVDGDGNLYISEYYGARIRKVSAATGHHQHHRRHRHPGLQRRRRAGHRGAPQRSMGPGPECRRRPVRRRLWRKQDSLRGGGDRHHHHRGGIGCV